MNVSQILIFGLYCTNYLFLIVNSEPCLNQPFEIFELVTQENTQEGTQDGTSEDTQKGNPEAIQESTPKDTKEERHKKIAIRYESEYGIRNVVTNFFYWGNNTFKISDAAKQALCSCAIYRVNQKIKNHMERKTHEILDALDPIQQKKYCTDIRMSDIPPWTQNYCAPMMICSSDGDVVGILKGYMKKSYKKPEYDIYLCHVKENGEKGDFYGIIPNVDVK